uniref:Ty3-gypsy retrotransposon protein n=1 Tax=Angiostrongylus cantonensis TaxID=6313 RepID=A0A0K0DN70_ANGCA
MVATKKRVFWKKWCEVKDEMVCIYYCLVTENDSGEGKTLSEVKKTDLALVRVVESMKQEQSAYENFGPSGGEVEGADNAKRAARQKSQRTPKTAKIAQKLGGDFDVECTQVEKSASSKLSTAPTPPLGERSASNSKHCDR